MSHGDTKPTNGNFWFFVALPIRITKSRSLIGQFVENELFHTVMLLTKKVTKQFRFFGEALNGGGGGGTQESFPTRLVT